MHCIRGPICLVSVNLETEPPFSLFLTFIHLSNPENTHRVLLDGPSV